MLAEMLLIEMTLRIQCKASLVNDNTLETDWLLNQISHV